MRSYVLPVFLFTTTLIGLHQAPAKPDHPHEKASVAELIRDLGHDRFEVREKATKALRRMPRAEPDLRRALSFQGADREVARRAQIVLGGFLAARRGWLLEQLKVDARAGYVDLLAERMACWNGADDEPGCWKPMFDLWLRFLDGAPKQLASVRSEWKAAHRDFRRYATFSKMQFFPLEELPRTLPKDGPPPEHAFAVRGGDLTVGPSLVMGSLFTAAGSIKVEHTAYGCCIVSTGRIECDYDAMKSVVLCDEVAEVKHGLGDSLVIARGDVRCSGGAQNSVVLSGGDVHVPTRSWYKHCLIRAAGRVHVPPKGPKGFLSTDTEIKEHDKDALSCVRFFRPAQVGVEVAPAEGGVRVTRADPDMAIGRAGLRVGDVVRAIDGAATDSPDSFRKRLRKKVAQGGYGLFEVRRGDKAVEVRPHFGG